MSSNMIGCFVVKAPQKAWICPDGVEPLFPHAEQEASIEQCKYHEQEDLKEEIQQECRAIEAHHCWVVIKG